MDGRRTKEQDVSLKAQDPVDGKIGDERLPGLPPIHDREFASFMAVSGSSGLSPNERVCHPGAPGGPGT
jgi:hypothetical protein